MSLLKKKISTKKGKAYLVFWSVYWAVSAYIFFSHTTDVLGEEESRGVRTWALYFGTAAFMAFCVVYCFRCWLIGKKRRDKKGREIKGRIKPWHFIITALVCVYCFYNVELVNNREKLFEMQFKYIVANIAGAVIMTLLFMAWFNSFRRSVIAILSFSATMSLIFYFVYLCRGEPLQLIDIYSFSTAMDVTDSYTFVYTKWVTEALTASLCAIGWVLHWNDVQIVFELKNKIILRVCAALFMTGGYFAYINTSWNTALGITVDLWDPKDTYDEVGTNLGFFAVAKFMKNTPPDGYSVSAAEDIADKSEIEYEEYLAENPAASLSETPVNIICIMNEAWADYTVFDNFSTNEDYMPFYSSLEENTVKGHTLVCITGGGTAKTEYEFLTGNSVKQYPGKVPYVSFFTHSEYSLVSTLKAQGFETVAMHPNKGSNWNRLSAYKFLGFDAFYTSDDFDENVEKFRNMISDRANYEKIIEVVENKDDSSSPLFLFDITMQNHGGYTGETYDISIEVDGFDNDAWNRYLSLVNESDDALKYLIEYFEDCGEPTMIVMFGDHFPSLDSETEEFLCGDEKDNLDIEKMQQFYQTPFFIWTNYDMPSESDVITSTNFLGTLMMERTGLEMTGYEHYQQLLMRDISAYNHKGYVTPDGSYTAWDDETDEVRRLINDYEILQYNNLVEDRNRLDWFFAVNQN